MLLTYAIEEHTIIGLASYADRGQGIRFTVTTDLG